MSTLSVVEQILANRRRASSLPMLGRGLSVLAASRGLDDQLLEPFTRGT